MKLLTPTEFAKLLNVAPVTVRKWAQKGMLNSITTPGGHRRYTYEELKRFSQKYNLPYTLESNSKTKLLVVDDDEQLRLFLIEKLKLKLAGLYEFETAADGFDAGRKLSTFKPDIVLLDLMMPGMDGFEVCHSIKSDPNTSHIRIIAMTGYPDTNSVQKITAAGADTCLAKPLDFNLLLETLGVSVESLSSVSSGEK